MTRSQTPRFPRSLTLLGWVAALSLAAGCAPPLPDDPRVGDPEPLSDRVFAPDPGFAPGLAADGATPAPTDAGLGTSSDPADADDGDDEGPPESQSPPAYVGDLTISTDAEADSFCADGFTSISGAMSVGEEVTSTSGLTCLESVGGSLTIDGAPALAEIRPFGSLVLVGGDLRVAALPALEWVDPFPILETVGGSFEIEGLSAVSTLDGVGALRSVGGRVAILDNASVGVISLASALQRVGGDVEIVWNQKAGLVSSFENLQVVHGSVLVEGMGAVDSLFPMSALVRIDGDLQIIENDRMKDIDAVAGLELIGGDVRIERNDRLGREAIDRFLSVGASIVAGQIYVEHNGEGDQEE